MVLLDWCKISSQLRKKENFNSRLTRCIYFEGIGGRWAALWFFAVSYRIYPVLFWDEAFIYSQNWNEPRLHIMEIEADDKGTLMHTRL